MARKKKIRVDLRKNRSKPARRGDITREFHKDNLGEDQQVGQERVRAKGELSRKRTIVAEDGDGVETGTMPAVDIGECRPGRVLCVHPLLSDVELDDGRLLRCTVRQLLRSLATDQRNIIASGDRVWVRPSGTEEGVIERVEPRHGVLARGSRGKEHIIVANVDQVVIVVSLVDPALKPHLIDRYICCAEQGGIRPIICLNKADLADPVALQPIIGRYSQLGIRTTLTSAVTGQGIARLRGWLHDRETVFAGQSGVGKSSLLNAIEPGLGLRVREVSEGTRKGRHTTTTVQLIRLSFGGWVVDTPGIRQFQLWNILPEEIEGLFAEMRPLVALCAFPDCTHTHEDRCAVKRAVERRQISGSRYETYLGMFHGTAMD
jgi:ribosome biogenesis GTPase